MPDAEAAAALIESPAAIAIVFLLGALFGSFANVCIYRIPRGLSVVNPPSHCFHCQTPVRWYDNLPVLGWILLRGKCRACKAPFSIRYALVEALLGGLTVLLWLQTTWIDFAGEPAPHRIARFGIYFLFLVLMAVIAFIDLDTKLIPDVLSLPAIPIFFGLGQLLGDVGIWDRLIGIAVGYGIVRAIADGYWYLTKREGMGYGDGKLLAVIGALLGWKAVLVALFGGAVLGSVIGVTALVIARRRSPEAPVEEGEEPPLRHVELPFGPFIVAAALTYLFLAERLEIAVADYLRPPV